MGTAQYVSTTGTTEHTGQLMVLALHRNSVIRVTRECTQARSAQGQRCHGPVNIRGGPRLGDGVVDRLHCVCEVAQMPLTPHRLRGREVRGQGQHKRGMGGRDHSGVHTLRERHGVNDRAVRRRLH